MRTSNSNNYLSNKDNQKRYEPLMLAGQNNTSKSQKSVKQQFGNQVNIPNTYQSNTTKNQNKQNQISSQNNNYFINSHLNNKNNQHSQNQQQQLQNQSDNIGQNYQKSSSQPQQPPYISSKTPQQRQGKNGFKGFNTIQKGNTSLNNDLSGSQRINTSQSQNNNNTNSNSNLHLATEPTPKGSYKNNVNAYFQNQNNNTNTNQNNQNFNNNNNNNSNNYGYNYKKKQSKNDVSLPPLESQNNLSANNGIGSNNLLPSNRPQNDENSYSQHQNQNQPQTPQANNVSINGKDTPKSQQSRKLVNSRKSLNRIIKQGYQPNSATNQSQKLQNGIGMQNPGGKTPLQSSTLKNNSAIQYGNGHQFFRGGQLNQSYNNQQKQNQSLKFQANSINNSIDSNRNNNNQTNKNTNLSSTPKGSNPQSFYLGKNYQTTPTTKPQKQGNQTNKLMDSQINNNTSTTNNNNSLSTNLENEDELLPYNQIPQLEQSKISSKNLGIITCYSANTHQGLVRNYNEDRVSIILNMMKPQNKMDLPYWPTCSFFGIYDGHGGQTCSEFLRDNLHYFIIKDEYFPKDPYQAIKRGFQKAENAWTEKADQVQLDRSGSCAIVAMLVDNICYAVNLGDSRAILSEAGGKKVTDLSTDHKPSEPVEEKRITSLGGKIYQSQIPVGINQRTGQQQIIKGPYRVLPGRLAVSRTIGDSEAKLPKYGGIKGVIGTDPDIVSFEIKDEHDFVILACDGVFDKMTNKEVIDCCWSVSNGQKNQHEFVGKAIEQVMRLSMMRKSFDNLTCVIIGLKNVETQITQQKSQTQKNNSNQNQQIQNNIQQKNNNNKQ